MRPLGGGRAWLLDLALGLLVVASTLLSNGPDETLVVRAPQEPLELLVLISAGAAVLSRRHPVPAVLVAAVLDAVPFWVPVQGAGYHLAVMIAMLMLFARRPLRVAAPVGGAVVVAQFALMAHDNAWQWNSVWPALAALTAAFPGLVGLAVRSRRRTVAALRERAEAAERSRAADAEKLLAEDRLRTARDLHDTVAHQIAVMNLNAGVASGAMRERPDDAERALVAVREAGRGVIDSISELLTGLRGEGWNDAARPSACRVADLRELVEGFRVLTADLTLDVEGLADEATQIDPVLLAVAREALTNAYKHGRSDAPVAARLHLRPDDAELAVVNLPAESGAGGGEGFGLRGMRERVEAAGGTLTITRAGDRFEVCARIPRGTRPASPTP